MKFICCLQTGIILIIIPQLYVSAPVKEDDAVKIKPEVFVRKYVNEDRENGHYFSYLLSDQQFREETFEIRNVGTDNEETVIIGTYRYTGPDGYIYNVNYVADKNGYHPTVRKLLPTITRISPVLVKSLIG